VIGTQIGYGIVLRRLPHHVLIQCLDFQFLSSFNVASFIVFLFFN